MDRRVVIGLALGIGALIAFGIMFFTTNKPTDSSATQQQPKPVVQSRPLQPANTPGTQPGTYTQYSDQALAEAKGRRLLFFHAGWCPQCRALEKSIQEQGVPEGMTILKVDYDTATSLRQKYGVTLQTTIVEVDANENELKQHVAYSDPSLPAVLEALK